MKVFQFLIAISLLSYSFNQLLTKYGNLETILGYVIFDSNDFDDGDKMYFKIEMEYYDFLDISIRYYYLDDNSYSPSSNNHIAAYTSSSSYSEYGVDYLRKYFEIKKKKSEYGSSSTGRYLVILLPVRSGDWAYIENTKEDEGKLPTWAIVVIVVVVVLIIVGLIIYFCYRRKKRMQTMAQTNAATVATAAAAANYATQQNLQAQVYHAQANQALAEAQVYQAQAQAQAYQAQMNSAQPYPPQNYQGSQPYPPQNYQAPPSSNDVGYSSKAVM